ncbi:hypothetical protein ACOSP7_019516 [Xanthoceras sorbifolium]
MMASDSNVSQNQVWWNCLWSLHIPYKIKIFIWKVSTALDRKGRCWSPPANSCWKINTDAALDLKRGKIGVGIIIRDHLGQVSEGAAILLGICFATNSGLCPASVESDAAVLVSAVNVDSTLNSEFGLVLHDIFSAINRFHILFVSYGPCGCNQAAHALAKLALSLESDLFMMGCVLPSVEYVTLADMSK